MEERVCLTLLEYCCKRPMEVDMLECQKNLPISSHVPALCWASTANGSLKEKTSILANSCASICISRHDSIVLDSLR